MKFAKSMALLILALVCMGAHAQAIAAAAPGPEAANTVPVGAEGVTVTAISTPNAVLQFGAGSTWATVTTPVLPFAANCYSGCPAQVGPDPAPGLAKSLVAIEQATAYTVTLSTGAVIQVPCVPSLCAAAASAALPPSPPASVSAVCTLPAALPGGTPAPLPTIPPTPPNCSPIAGAVPVATDGQMAVVMTLTAPLYLQYCQGAVCDAPFVFAYQPLVIGPTATLGGPPGGTGTGTLYAIPGQGPTVVAVAPVGTVNITVPAAAAN